MSTIENVPEIIIKTGLDLFGDMDRFKCWLETPNFALGNVKPLVLLQNSDGQEMVIGELTRISHGIFV
jgi:uncharacterized protein (DUF2384 family)